MSHSTTMRRFGLAGALLTGWAALMLAGAPAFAQGHGGGGHGGGGGGFSGGHASGGHMGGGRGYAGGGARGFSGGRPSYGGARASYAPRAGFTGGARMGYVPRANFTAARGRSYGSSQHFAPRAGFVGGSRGGAHLYPGHGYGFAPGHRPGYGHYWSGGSWRGSYWPRVSYGWGFPLFLPVLPALYGTYWWGGVPYYYANDVYYTYDSGQNGYVVTDPPPVAGTEDSADDSSQQPATGSSEVYAYPQKGQSEEQQANDKYECHNWARSQSGFDPTHVNSGQTGNADDYRRAMSACLDARGYSAQ